MEKYNKIKEDYNYIINTIKGGDDSVLVLGEKYHLLAGIVGKSSKEFNFHSAYDYHINYDIGNYNGSYIDNNIKNHLFLFKLDNNSYIVKNNKKVVITRDYDKLIKNYPYTNIIKSDNNRMLVNSKGTITLYKNDIKVKQHIKEDNIMPIRVSSYNSGNDQKSKDLNLIENMDIKFNHIIGDSNNIYIYVSDKFFCIVIEKEPKEKESKEKEQVKSYRIITLSYTLGTLNIISFYDIKSKYKFNYENIQTLDSLFVTIDKEKNINEIWGFANGILINKLKTLKNINKIIGFYDNEFYNIILLIDDKLNLDYTNIYRNRNIVIDDIKNILTTQYGDRLCILYNNNMCKIYHKENTLNTIEIENVINIYTINDSIIALKNDKTIKYYCPPRYEKLYNNVKKIIDGKIENICTDKKAVAILLNNNNVIILDEKEYKVRGGFKYKYYKLIYNNNNFEVKEVYYNVPNNYVDNKTIIMITQFIYILFLLYFIVK
jgi:hypothetical protein